MTGPSSTYEARKSLSGRPGGTRLFSVAAMTRVPYFASILPHVVRMEPGLAEVKVPNWFFVHNHLHTVHAIASCNAAAEMAMGMLMEATVPPGFLEPPLDPESDDGAVSGQSHHVAARAGPAGPTGLFADHRRRRGGSAGKGDRSQRHRSGSCRHHDVDYTGSLRPGLGGLRHLPIRHSLH